MFCSCSRFGGSQSSQCQGAIKTPDQTVLSGNEASVRAACSDSEKEEEQKEGADPFLDRGKIRAGLSAMHMWRTKKKNECHL